MNSNFYPFLRFVSKTTYFIDGTVVARDCRILYIISGYGSFESGGTTVKLCPNTLIFYPYDKPYCIKSEAESEMLFYTLNFDFSQDYTDIKTMCPQPANKHRQEYVLRSIPDELRNVFSNIIRFDNALWAENDIKHIYTEALNRDLGYGKICNSHLTILLTNIYRKVLKKGSNNSVCEKIKDLIEKNLQINIKELAAVLNYHPFYLNEVFKKNEGVTLHKYLIQQRLIKAYELISTTQMPLIDIADICGFSSQSHFSSVFKNTYRITPGKLRRQI